MSENEKLREALEKIARKTSITFGRGTMSGEEAAAIAREALSTPPSKADADDVERIKHMVDRFLMWRLPPDFAPDGGVIFSHTSGGRVNEPIGTNLLTAVQAEAMVRFMVEGLPAIQNRDAGLREALKNAFDGDDVATKNIALRKAYDALSTPCVEQDADEVKRMARAICEAFGDDPNREGPWREWYRDSPYYRAALSAIQSRDAGLRAFVQQIAERDDSLGDDARALLTGGK